MTNQIVTISFFNYEGFQDKWQAFRRMGLFDVITKPITGLIFHKLLGSGGGNGFSVFPDFGTYAFLAVWNTEEDAKSALSNNKNEFHTLRASAKSVVTIFMKTMQVHGTWDKVTPFSVAKEFDKNLPVGVITRATIKTKKLLKFWKYVPSVSKSMDNKPGLLFSKGIGELPLIQQATFSIWESSNHMMSYAYKSKYHKEVVQKTRELGWYKEELFARFYPYTIEGDVDTIPDLNKLNYL